MENFLISGDPQCSTYLYTAVWRSIQVFEGHDHAYQSTVFDMHHFFKGGQNIIPCNASALIHAFDNVTGGIQHETEKSTLIVYVPTIYLTVCVNFKKEKVMIK